MSIWSDIGRFLQEAATDAFSSVVESIRTVFGGDASTRKRVAFSVAIIALSAKMAKADGVVTEEEVKAFQEIFAVPPEEMNHVSRLYNLAKGDVAGYTAYGQQVRSLFPGDDPADEDVLTDVLDALFHIAKADNVIHENELLFLEDLAVLFGFDELAFGRIKARHLGDCDADSYRVLEAESDWDYERLKAQYRAKVRDNHPDRLIARGVPPEFVVLANERLAAINAAWEAIEPLHRPVQAVAVAGR
ncbi:TerB family tellurite resistance protein [Pseudahrensia aquimaris]|uniref:TerB family tellurite resistance protein n=1 Tax=Pseudahrensia aquimaris TaxID=744461 RepID=A0ABW3FCR9_9HYPH